MKSKLDQQIEDAFYYAVNFYSTNDRSILMQEFCLSQMMLYGLDRGTCIKIQNPIMDVFMMGELMQIGSQITQQHLAIITNNIRQHLLGLQPTLKPDVVNELPKIPTVSSSGNGGGKRDNDGVSVEVKNIVQDFTTNGYKNQNLLMMSNYNLEPHDMNYLSGTMPNYKYNFTLVDFSNNPRIEALGLDYILKGAPGILSLQQGNTDISVMYQGMLTRPSFNIVKLDLSNCNIGDIGADILGHALANGRLPATKHIDVSGNKITEEGENFFVKALKDPTVQHIAVLLEDLGQNLKIQSGRKEDVVPELHRILHSAEKRGVDVQHMVVDLSFLTWYKNLKGMATVATRGFIKCKWTEDPIGDWAKDSLAAKLPKSIQKPLKKFIDSESTVSCFIKSYDQAITSEFGAQTAINDLHIIGESYVPESFE